MLNFKQILTFAYESEYESAYVLSKKRLFSRPKIYTGNNDLSRRWYVYFSFRDPETGRLKRQTPIYGDANCYKTKEERIVVLSVYKNLLLDLLKKGFNPYKDNTELYKKLNNKKSEYKASEMTISNAGRPIVHDVPKERGATNENITNQQGETTLEKAFEIDFEIKSEILKTSSQRSYNSHISVFKKWLKDNYSELEYIEQVDKPIVVEFLDYILTKSKSSARNRNNYRASLSSLFSTLEERELVQVNFVKKTKVYNTSPTRNKSYTVNQQKEIFDYLQNEDTTLLLFIKFVSYNFLRPIEVCRLRVGDINIDENTLSFKAKNSAFKTKIIPKILSKELPDLSKLGKDDFLFTPEGIGGKWNGSDDTKRNYFTKRFKKVVKKRFSLGEEYGMYSFRHTFISRLYSELVKGSSPHEAKSKLMQITGHSSMRALEAYLRSIDAELPEDYSKMIKE